MSAASLLTYYNIYIYITSGASVLDSVHEHLYMDTFKYNKEHKFTAVICMSCDSIADISNNDLFY